MRGTGATAILQLELRGVRVRTARLRDAVVVHPRTSLADEEVHIRAARSSRQHRRLLLHVLVAGHGRCDREG